MDFCIIEAIMPSNIFAFKGYLVIVLQCHDGKTTIEGASVIPGQLIDWGRSKMCINGLFDDIRDILGKN